MVCLEPQEQGSDQVQFRRASTSRQRNSECILVACDGKLHAQAKLPEDRKHNVFKPLLSSVTNLICAAEVVKMSKRRQL